MSDSGATPEWGCVLVVDSAAVAGAYTDYFDQLFAKYAPPEQTRPIESSGGVPVPDILRRREKGFVLWIPRGQSQAAGPLIGTVRNTIDCRNLGFVDGSQAINYVASQFVEGFRQSRLLDMLRNVDSSEKRIKLAFACLLTAVGIPRRLAGEEFADEQDDLAEVPDRPRLARVNFERLNSSDSDAAMRRRVFEYVSRLIHSVRAHLHCGSMTSSSSTWISTESKSSRGSAVGLA